jgi:hypothetical protein
LGFASLKPKGSQVGSSRLGSLREEDDEDDPYAYDDKDDYDEEEEDVDDDNVDLDVLPTMLVYRNGDLVHNWVRVDWEAGEAGLEEYLTKSVAMPRLDVFSFADFRTAQTSHSSADIRCKGEPWPSQRRRRRL